MKKSNLVVVAKSEFEKAKQTEITVGEAHELYGTGAHILMRPDGTINYRDPDSDRAILFD